MSPFQGRLAVPCHLHGVSRPHSPTRHSLTENVEGSICLVPVAALPRRKPSWRPVLNTVGLFDETFTHTPFFVPLPPFCWTQIQLSSVLARYLLLNLSLLEFQEISLDKTTARFAYPRHSQPSMPTVNNWFVRFLENHVYSMPPPPPRKRTRPMEVICVGMPRSGTESLQQALLKLGVSGRRTP